ncbi:MAG: hypothetical protein ACXADU_18800 [Promethearchaeota archaeon]|jgi:putative membrane protein
MEENERPSWVKIFIIILIVIVGFVILASLLGSGTGMMGGMMGFGWLFILLPIILIIFLIYTLTGRDRDTYKYSPQPYSGRESPLEVLERRYVNGEISRNDYLRMKKDIEDKY